ncbi:MarR family winged helix-turn-helix transcriptional regulator [Myroides odoratus]|uniref:MarR family winged helix-turn-helix transcriptional regulator n=1 Tax=Myroides odoratus TaxID=256 RepID=UPI0039B01BE2
MNHKLLIEFIHLIFEFENETKERLFPIYSQNVNGFKNWIRDKKEQQEESEALEVEQAKLTSEQKIALSFFNLANYSKMYWRSFLIDTPFAMPDNLIFLLNLWVYGEMTKMELIRKSTQEKPTGMQIVNRLIELKLVQQKDSQVDKRSKIIEITELGHRELLRNKAEIQRVSQVITGDLKEVEKQNLLHLLTRLTQYHEEVFNENKSKDELIQLISKFSKSENTAKS